MEMTRTAQPYAFDAEPQPQLEHEHEWRLFTREPNYLKQRRFFPDNNGPDSFMEYTSEIIKSYTELWYCTKCRHEEKRVVPDVR
jgi:hypothetical protein